jgi:23S rRNA (adenine2503-C2)-methyltransferase
VNTQPDLRNFTLQQLQNLAAELGENTTRTENLFAQIHSPNINSFDDLNNISAAFISKIRTRASLTSLTMQQKTASTDGTLKYLFRLNDNLNIETVLIPSGRRHTLCVSTQAGCAMGCKFCRTASMGLRRNLLTYEIIGQILPIMQELKKNSSIINNIVLMGMGEPLNNTQNVISAIKIMQHSKGLNFSPRKITISTCGIIPEMKNFAAAADINIALSLHAADNDTRNLIMPINRKYPLDQLLQSCREIASDDRPILIEYILLRDVNDSPQQAQTLAGILADIPCKINLIPYNPTPELPFQPSTSDSTKTFLKIIHESGHFVRLRHSRGNDIAAACGQLATQSKNNE